MKWQPGTHLGPYEIVTRIGSGGMGEVYRAKDRKLGRAVALKLLREEFAADPDRLSRFEREARSASPLNHPNIITIYDIDQVRSTPFIVMELVEGRTLRELLTARRPSLREILSLGIQMADGLSKAHEAGIVHRDLKPENVMITEDGRFAKILDFGLAKLTDSSRVDSTEWGGVGRHRTASGIILGTAGYMSPEQAAGRTVDYQCDQFATRSPPRETRTSGSAISSERSSGIVPPSSCAAPAEGKIYCEYDAPNPEAIRDHARRAGLPADKISEVALEMSPDMFH